MKTYTHTVKQVSAKGHEIKERGSVLVTTTDILIDGVKPTWRKGS